MYVLTVFVVLSLVGAVIGYTTKWTSVQLMFKPARFIGIGPLGWQGVVQRRSPKFALGVAGTLREVLPFEEVLDRIDADELAELVATEIEPRLETSIPDMLNVVSPGFWDSAPDEVRTMVREMLRAEVVAAVAEIVTESRPVVVRNIDIDALAVSLLSGENADRLARLMQTIGSRELRTVIRYGAVVGFFVGVVEAIVYLRFHEWWLLPLIGAADGLINNWMGIQMIFRPLERRRYFGVFPYQGLFPARQAQIAQDYAEQMAGEVLTPAALIEHLGSSGGAEVAEVALGIVRRRLASQLAILGPSLGVDVTPDLVDRLVDAAVATIASGADVDVTALPSVVDYVNERLQIAATIEERLAAMDKQEFETILRGVFEEDERLLIGIGGVIGAAIGCLQAVIVLAIA